MRVGVSADGGSVAAIGTVGLSATIGRAKLSCADNKMLPRIVASTITLAIKPAINCRTSREVVTLASRRDLS